MVQTCITIGGTRHRHPHRRAMGNVSSPLWIFENPVKQFNILIIKAIVYRLKFKKCVCPPTKIGLWTSMVLDLHGKGDK